MTNLSTEYLDFLSELQGAPLQSILYQHQVFWLKREKQFDLEFRGGDDHVYHAGTIPAKITQSLADNWFFEPEVHLQRVGLYADFFVFDDIVGNILTKIPNISKDDYVIVANQVQNAINVMLKLKKWGMSGIVKILPTDYVLRRIFNDDEFKLLNALSLEQSTSDLPEEIKGKLSPEQQQALSISAGQTLIYKVNKVNLLGEKLEFYPSADDTFFDIYCTMRNWDHKVLEDMANVHLLKKIKPKYLCDSPDLVLYLREKDKVSNVRKFLREEAHQFFGNDIQARSQQASVDEFSRRLRDQIEEANAELDVLKMKLRTKLATDLAIAGGSMAIAVGIDFAAGFASWIPQFVGSLPSIHAGTNILEAIKDYRVNSSEIKNKPAFILGSQMEKTR